MLEDSDAPYHIAASSSLESAPYSAPFSVWEASVDNTLMFCGYYADPSVLPMLVTQPEYIGFIFAVMWVTFFAVAICAMISKRSKALYKRFTY